MTTINEILTDMSLKEIDAMTMAQRAERLRNRYSTYIKIYKVKQNE